MKFSSHSSLFTYDITVMEKRSKQVRFLIKKFSMFSLYFLYYFNHHKQKNNADQHLFTSYGMNQTTELISKSGEIDKRLRNQTLLESYANGVQKGEEMKITTVLNCYSNCNIHHMSNLYTILNLNTNFC